MQAYGLDYKTEVAARRTTVAFLQEAGIKLRQYPVHKQILFHGVCL